MATIVLPYKDLNQTMRGIRRQVLDSLDFCANEMPRFRNPEEMFRNLKQMVSYQQDPPGTELLQSVPTLMQNNYWNRPGAGDCDCFTILVLSMCCVHGWNDQQIILAGRNRKDAVHIWSRVKHNGKWYGMDLTNAYINIERPYKYIQVLHV